MKITINNTGEKLVSFRVQLEAGDNVYEHEVSEYTKYPETFKNDFVVQNSQREVNSQVRQFDPEIPPVYENVPTFDMYFDGITLVDTNPDFIQACKDYLTDEQDFVIV